MMTRGSELASQLGHPILPARFRVEDDPTLDRLGGVPLVGKYALDEEGVPAQKVLLVDGGVLKGFVMSRTPRKGFPKSNGHGRGGLSGNVRGRIGSLIVRTDRGVSDAELRKQLLAEVRKAGQSYGIIVRLLDEPGITGLDDPSSFLRPPTMNGSAPRELPQVLLAVKITLDGKEEIVRGVTLAPIPVAALKQIAAAGKTLTAYNYPAQGSLSVLSLFFTGSLWGGETSSLAIPTSVVAPALLFKEVTVRRPTEPQRRPPLLPHPAFVPETK
jgi:TldD protein